MINLLIELSCKDTKKALRFILNQIFRFNWSKQTLFFLFYPRSRMAQNLIINKKQFCSQIFERVYISHRFLKYFVKHIGCSFINL